MMLLTDCTEVIRSKNSGPYELTFDIIFKTREAFESAAAKGIISRGLIADLYGIGAEDVLNVVEFPPANAVKVTIRRPLCSGDLGETDVYGAQQHAPLLSIEV